MRATNQKRDRLSAIEVAEQHLGMIIDFASTKSNISKDLKTALLRPRQSKDDAKQDHERFVKTDAAAELAKAKVTTSIQTEAFTFEGSPKSVADATVFDNHSQKQFRQPSGENLPSDKRLGGYIPNAGKSDPSQASRKAGKAVTIVFRRSATTK